MASQGRIVFSLGIASAVLAALVPGVLDAPALATASPARVVTSIDVALPAPVPSPVEIVPKPVIASAAPSILKPVGPMVRTRVPVGCERLVSPLVRSAAAAQLGRCVT